MTEQSRPTLSSAPGPAMQNEKLKIKIVWPQPAGRIFNFAFLIVNLLAVALFTGCHSIGPHTVATDRFDYSSAIADSWKQQTLLNIVKLRYMDLPVFVDVSSVVAGYSLQTGITAGGSFPANRRCWAEFRHRRRLRPFTPTGPPSPTRR